MAVRRGNNGNWRYRKVVTTPDGKKIRISGTPQLNTKLAAEADERAHLLRVLSPPPERKEVPRFKAFVQDRWLPTYPAAVGNRPMTVREKEIHVRVHLVPALGRLPVDEIRGEVVDRFFARLRAKGLSAKTVRNVRATLRRILASAVDWGILSAVPPLPKVKVTDSSWDFLTREESDLLVSAARNAEERAILLFALHTGARAGEQIALEWGDVDWQSRKIVFRRSSTRGVVGPTKSGHDRKVPLTETLERALRSMRHLRSQQVFCNADGSPLTLWQLHDLLWGACRRSGLRRIRWHDMRHSFASQLMQAGVPIRHVQDWMGHSTIAMTMRYSHLAPGGGADLIQTLDAPPREPTTKDVGT
jgi:integrase